MESFSPLKTWSPSTNPTNGSFGSQRISPPIQKRKQTLLRLNLYWKSLKWYNQDCPIPRSEQNSLRNLKTSLLEASHSWTFLIWPTFSSHSTRLWWPRSMSLQMVKITKAYMGQRIKAISSWTALITNLKTPQKALMIEQLPTTIISPTFSTLIHQRTMPTKSPKYTQWKISMTKAPISVNSPLTWTLTAVRMKWRNKSSLKPIWKFQSSIVPKLWRKTISKKGHPLCSTQANWSRTSQDKISRKIKFHQGKLQIIHSLLYCSSRALTIT